MSPPVLRYGSDRTVHDGLTRASFPGTIVSTRAPRQRHKREGSWRWSNYVYQPMPLYWHPRRFDRFRGEVLGKIAAYQPRVVDRGDVLHILETCWRVCAGVRYSCCSRDTVV